MPHRYLIVKMAQEVGIFTMVCRLRKAQTG